MIRNAWLRSLACGALAVLLTSPVQAQKTPSQIKEFATTVDYVTHFYPVWFTYYQSSLSARPNTLAGPDKVTPIYQIVVAINVDTYYASSFLDMSTQPTMLTIPATTASYSILTLDPYGNTINVGLPKQQGLYALTGPDYSGEIPDGAVRINMPWNNMVLIFRADKYSSTGESEKDAALEFRKSLLLQPLSDWNSNPTGGATSILPEKFFAAPFKTAADGLATKKPILFLQQLQTAVNSGYAPLSAREQEIANTFNTLFDAGGDMSQFASGTQAAHQLILDDYYSHVDEHFWINFTNMGTWKPSQFLDRAAITEFIQYGNNHSTAAYYQTFKAADGTPLDGSGGAVYVLHLSKDEIPQAQRFWSFTAYTPESVELIRNDVRKFHVASYTRDLHYDPDGGLTLFMSKRKPPHVHFANWLPVSDRLFNIMLRVYGPEGATADGTYLPPAIFKK